VDEEFEALGGEPVVGAVDEVFSISVGAVVLHGVRVQSFTVGVDVTDYEMGDEFWGVDR